MQLTKIARGIFSLAAVIPFISTLMINFALTNYNHFDMFILFSILVGIVIFCAGCFILRFYIRFSQRYSPLKAKFKSICLVRSNPIIFVLVYLLPVISNYPLNYIQSIFLIVILFTCIFVVHTVAISPIINVLGYRIYKITNSTNCEFILLSRRDINSLSSEIQFFKIDPFTFVEKEK